MVRFHCESILDSFLAAWGDVAVLTLGNLRDHDQQWIKLDSWGLRVNDEASFLSFSLLNKATRHVLKQRYKEWEQIYTLADYNHGKADESILWTLIADVGNGYRCPTVKNIHFNMDIKFTDSHVRRIRDGNVLILSEWRKQSNQKWKL